MDMVEQGRIVAGLAAGRQPQAGWMGGGLDDGALTAISIFGQNHSMATRASGAATRMRAGSKRCNNVLHAAHTRRALRTQTRLENTKAAHGEDAVEDGALFLLAARTKHQAETGLAAGRSGRRQW